MPRRPEGRGRLDRLHRRDPARHGYPYLYVAVCGELGWQRPACPAGRNSPGRRGAHHPGGRCRRRPLGCRLVRCAGSARARRSASCSWVCRRTGRACRPCPPAGHRQRATDRRPQPHARRRRTLLPRPPQRQLGPWLPGSARPGPGNRQAVAHRLRPGRVDHAHQPPAPNRATATPPSRRPVWPDAPPGGLSSTTSATASCSRSATSGEDRRLHRPRPPRRRD